MRRSIFLLFISLGLCPGVKAQSVYENVYQLVRDHNPDINSMKANMQAQLSQMRVDNNLEDPEIEFGRVWGTNTPENKWDLSLTQTFDFPTLYSARRQSIDATRQSLYMELEVLVVEKLQEAKLTLIELAYCDKVLEVQTSIMNNLDSVQTLLIKSFAAGEATILDVNKAKIEYVNVCRTVAQTQSTRSELLVRLNALCGGGLCSSEVVASYPAEALRDISYYYNQAESSAVIAAYNARIRSEIVSGKVSKLESFPKITVGYQHEREGSDSFDGFKLGLTLPVFSVRGKSRRSNDALLSLNYELDATRLELTAAVDAEYANVIAIKWLLDKMAPVFSSTDHPALLRKAFLGGELSALDYLTELNYFRQAEAEYLSSERDYHLALARLNRYAQM